MPAILGLPSAALGLTAQSCLAIHGSLVFVVASDPHGVWLLWSTAALQSNMPFPFAAHRVAQGAQSGLYTSFPFCKCKKTPSAYKLGDIVTAKGNGQFCFKLSAKVPAGCTDYCCSKADLKKIEVRVVALLHAACARKSSGRRTSNRRLATELAAVLLAVVHARLFARLL